MAKAIEKLHDALLKKIGISHPTKAQLAALNKAAELIERAKEPTP